MWNSFNAFTLCYVTGRPDAINSIFELVSRESWGATELLTRQKLNPSNVEHILVYHTATPECFSPDECIQAVRSLQVRKRKWIPFNSFSLKFSILNFFDFISAERNFWTWKTWYSIQLSYRRRWQNIWGQRLVKWKRIAGSKWYCFVCCFYR